jgi:hypothetical protein
LMALGLATAAVVTAQIASSFLDQAVARRSMLAGQAASPEGAPTARAADAPTSDAVLAARLERIEQLLTARADGDDRPPAAPT